MPHHTETIRDVGEQERTDGAAAEFDRVQGSIQTAQADPRWTFQCKQVEQLKKMRMEGVRRRDSGLTSLPTTKSRLRARKKRSRKRSGMQ